MKHTPAPWYYHLKSPYFAITTKESSGNPKWDIARTYTSFDAQLIAAAPELLAACKLAVRYVAKMVADEVKTALPPEIALEHIENAIKKAEED